MGPLNIDLKAYSDAVYRETIAVTCDGVPQEWSGWSDIEILAAESVWSIEALLTGSVDSSTTGKLVIEFAMADLAALFPDGESRALKRFPYVLRAKPTGTYRVRLMYGILNLNKGLPL